MAPDSTKENAPIEEQRCRYWLLDTDKGEQEIVRTAYKAVEAAVLHEMQEEFTYRTIAVMDPHRDLIGHSPLGNLIKAGLTASAAGSLGRPAPAAKPAPPTPPPPSFSKK